MIIVKLFGGLGNHMTQIALYIYLKKKLQSEDIKLDFISYKYTSFHNGFRAEYIFDLPFKSGLKTSYGLLERIYYKCFEIINSNIRRCRCFYQVDQSIGTDFDNFVDNLSSDKNYIFNGVWNSPNFFPGIETEIKHIFSFRKNLSFEKIHKYIDKIKENNSVVMHVRRGDYVNTNFIPLAETDYYIRALSMLNAKTNTQISNILIVSDDIEWCKSNFKFNKTYNCIYVEGTNDYEDLYLLQSSCNLIIANSTFSWWGAFLSNAENIICPLQFFSNKPNTKKEIKFIYKDNWEVI